MAAPHFVPPSAALVLLQRSLVPNKWSDVLLFFKFYDVLTEKLTFVGRMYAPTSMSIGEVGIVKELPPDSIGVFGGALEASCTYSTCL